MRALANGFLPQQSRLIHNFHANSERHGQPRCLDCQYPDEDWCLCRWHCHWIPQPMGRPSSCYGCLSTDQRLYNPRVDLANFSWRSFGVWFHDSILRSRSLGCDSYPPERALASCLPFILPRYHCKSMRNIREPSLGTADDRKVPTRKHDLFAFCPNSQRHR